MKKTVLSMVLYPVASKLMNNNKREKYTNALIKKLQEHNVEAAGEMLYLSYDSPYKFYGRRNEVIVAVKY